MKGREIRLPLGAWLAAIALFAILVFAEGAGLLAEYEANRQYTAAQQRAGQLVEAKLCASFGRLAALKPPPGNPRTNPSRGYLQGEHDVLVSLGTDLGCRR